MKDIQSSPLPPGATPLLPCVRYISGFVPDAQAAFNELWAELQWVRMGNTPRREYYANDVEVPYTYGRGAGIRTYAPQPWHPRMRAIQKAVEEFTGVRLEACFLNGYANSRDHLGAHADDSPEMDDARPIAIVTLGAVRDIWFHPNENPKEVSKLPLEPGSLCLMMPGMQDTHQHRIPKAGREVGPRISLTLRGYVEPKESGK